MMGAGTVLGQQNGAPAPSKSVPMQPLQSSYYYVGPEVTLPELLPTNLLQVFAGECKELDDSVEFIVVVNETGEPRTITNTRKLVSDADQLALKIVRSDRFTPGTHWRKPVAVVVSVTVNLKGCVEAVKGEWGRKSKLFQLRSQPAQDLEAIVRTPRGLALAGRVQPSTNSGSSKVYKVGAKVTAPVVLKIEEPRFTEEARRAKIQGSCTVSLIVDANGMPQDARMEVGIDPGLDQNALDAVSKYRFRPAMKDGQPVPVPITIEVAFRIY